MLTKLRTTSVHSYWPRLQDVLEIMWIIDAGVIKDYPHSKYLAKGGNTACIETQIALVGQE
jgi:hypothetical protein